MYCSGSAESFLDFLSLIIYSVSFQKFCRAFLHLPVSLASWSLDQSFPKYVKDRYREVACNSKILVANH